MSKARDLASVASRSADLKPGTTAFFAMSTAPAGWLKANGAAVSRTDYADLFAAIGTTYGSGNGSTTFNLPDLRGEFPRGLDDGRGVDTGRSIGSAQESALGSHAHSLGYVSGLLGGGGFGAFQQGTGTNTTASGGAETRPRNVALLACIKF
jgi:phage-related tail fiber protein